MNRKALAGIGLTVGLLATAGLAFAAGSAAVQTSIAPVASTVDPGGTLLYNVRFSCVSTVSDCAGAVVTVTVPAPLTYAAYSTPGGFVAASSSSGATVTFTLTDPLPAGATGSATVAVQAPWCHVPSDPVPGLLVATSEMSAVSATTVTDAADPITINGLSDCSTSAPVAPLQKWGSSAAVGGLVRWGINLPTSSSAYSVEDVLPASMTMHNLYTWPGVSVSVDCGTGYTPITTELIWESTLPASCTVGGSSRNTRTFPTLRRFRIDVPANTSGFAYVYTYQDATVVPSSTVTNCLDYVSGGSGSVCGDSFTYPGQALPDAQGYLIGAPNIPLAAPFDWFSSPPISASAATPMGSRDLVLSLRVNNAEQSGADINNPVLTQLLDPLLEYDGSPGANWWQAFQHAWAPDGVPAAVDPMLQPGCQNPIFNAVPNAVGSQTLLRWTFNNCVLPGGGIEGSAGVGVYVSVRLRNTATSGSTVSNTGTISLADSGSITPYLTNWCWTGDPDVNDLDGDGYTTDALCGANTVTWTVPSGTEAILATAYVQGALDTVPTKYPAVGTTDLTGEASYTFLLENSGTSPLTRLDLVDVLPSVGDETTASPATPRLSEWAEELVAIDAVERGDGSGSFVPVGASEVAIGVSSSRTPCRWDSTNGDQLKAAGGSLPAIATVTGPAGCTADPWAAGPVSGAASWALLYQPSTPLAPGEVLRVTIRARLNGALPPVSAVPLESWNSIAYTATLLSATGPFELLTGEPMKVGVRFADPAATAKLGGIIWKDLDRDGSRDEVGSVGIAGVAVSVFDASGAKVTTVYTDSDGAYEVAGLQPNQGYRLEVGLTGGAGSLNGYYLSPANADPDPTRSCKASTSGSLGVVNATTGAGGTVDSNNNFGASQTRPPT